MSFYHVMFPEGDLSEDTQLPTHDVIPKKWMIGMFQAKWPKKGNGRSRGIINMAKKQVEPDDKTFDTHRAILQGKYGNHLLQSILILLSKK